MSWQFNDGKTQSPYATRSTDITDEEYQEGMRRMGEWHDLSVRIHTQQMLIPAVIFSAFIVALGVTACILIARFG